jgi:hypothetical protein
MGLATFEPSTFPEYKIEKSLGTAAPQPRNLTRKGGGIIGSWNETDSNVPLEG